MIMLVGLVVFSHVLALLITPWFHIWWLWSILSHYGLVFGVLSYLGCATPCSWMMGLAPQGVRWWWG
jgi:hypothetical protein